MRCGVRKRGKVRCFARPLSPLQLALWRDELAAIEPPTTPFNQLLLQAFEQAIRERPAIVEGPRRSWVPDVRMSVGPSAVEADSGT